MKKWILLLALAGVCMALSACSGSSDSGKVSDGKYEVILPEGYEESEKAYPVIYLLPQDGYMTDDSGIAQLLQQTMKDKVSAEMIVVKTAFDENANVGTTMNSIVEKIDSAYRTIPEKECRALVGTGTGGYLAYILGLEQKETFAAMASIRGDFVSDENPWYETCGDVYSQIKKMQDFGAGYFEKIYTYLDAPVTDTWTNMEGSTNDIGSMFIDMGTSSTSHEFTVRTGGFGEDFLKESVNRVADRLTNFMAISGVEGTEELNKETAGEQEKAGTVLVKKEEAQIDGDYQMLDLSGSWYFNYIGMNGNINMKTLTAEEYTAWSVVEPGLGRWKKGYGNISSENVDASYGEEYFNYFITGSGYYVKEFELPQEFDSQELALSVGYVDDRCEVYLNGEWIGSTGLDKGMGMPTGDSTWAKYSEFEVDPSLLKFDEVNTVIVHAWNDQPYGEGGWYEGPICLASKDANPGEGLEEKDPYFYEETLESVYAAKALGKDGTVKNPYLIYLPKDYYESEKYYPTLYLLHQFNSDHTSYRTDDISEVLNEGIELGMYEEMIVVIPNSSEESWWTGEWEKMITDELIPAIDDKYRTIQDARYRFTAGCSMGGQGAMSVALTNPDYFSGAASFFGALSMAPTKEEDVLQIAANESKEYLDYFAMYFSCGNQDIYKFGEPAIELNQTLEEKGIEHQFFIENGNHDSDFYVPYFNSALQYVRSQMFETDDAVKEAVSGKLSTENKDGLTVSAQFEATDKISEYFNVIPASSYTENENPKLSIPLLVQVVQDGKVVHTEVMKNHMVDAEDKEENLTYELSRKVDLSKGYEISFKAVVFDQVVELDKVAFEK